DLATEGNADLLLHLRGMSMIADLVGAKVFIDFGKELLDRRLPTGAGRPRLGIHHDGRGVNQVAPDERQDAQECTRRIAPRIGDDLRFAQLASMELAEPVDRSLEQIGRGMLGAIDLAIRCRIAQAKIRRDVDHLETLAYCFGGERRPDALRQARDYDLRASGQFLAVQLFERRQINPRQVTINPGHFAPGIVLRCEQRDLDEWMPGKDAYRLDPGIARGPQNGNFDPVVRAHRYSSTR